jgi:hypothetical protein
MSIHGFLGHINVDDLYIHELSPQPDLPLNGAPAMIGALFRAASDKSQVAFAESSVCDRIAFAKGSR